MPRLAAGWVLLWPILLVVGFIRPLLHENPFAGYRWLGELALAMFLLIALSLAILEKGREFFRFSKVEIAWIVLPLALFTLWSAVSCFWALSWRAALHHTLLWACFDCFYVLVRSATRAQTHLVGSLRITGLAILVISTVCLIEFFFTPPSATFNFTTRYYQLIEITVSLLPLLVVAGINNLSWGRALLLNLLAWASIVAVAARTMFVAGVTGILTLTGLALVTHRRLENMSRWLVLLGLATVITFGVQLFNADKDRELFQRFAGSSVGSVENVNSRLLFAGFAVAGIWMSPLEGVGADNYFAQYKALRENFSGAYTDSKLLEIGEGIIPERAHNEYLQILCELGLVGGVLFGWLLAGVGYMFVAAVRRRASLLTLAALGGIAAFLVSSFASSYSFRLPANGACFFFLLAVAAREIFARDAGDEVVDRTWLRPVVLTIALLASVSMLGFSAVRAVSIYHLSNSQNSADKEYSGTEIDKAISLDPSEPMFRFELGQQLYFSGNYAEAALQMQFAIEHGLATSPVYFNLVAVEMLGDRHDDARRTFQEALRVYPRSVFLRTGYAAFLKREGENAKAELEYQEALQINPAEARSWQLAHDEGLERLALAHHADSTFLPANELLPDGGALALENFQRR
jgi:O-antigen ligase